MQDPASTDVVNLERKFGCFADLWSPRIVAQFNDYHVKIAKVEGEFVWHSHPETDELFFVHKGRLTIELRGSKLHELMSTPTGRENARAGVPSPRDRGRSQGREVTLNPGELYVVPKGVEHRPVAHTVCEILMFEPAGTVNTGDAGGELTASDLPWL